MSSQGTITRDGYTPTYAAYITSYCIVDLSSTPPITRNNYPTELQNCAPRITSPGPQDMVIPSWQRKLVWKEEDFDNLIHTQSNMYGSIILSRGPNQTDSWTLIDGLQRFSVGTAILNALYDRVLSPTPSNQTAATYFSTVSNQIGRLSPVFKWNHKMLLEHGRSGIRTSYDRLFNEVDKYVEKSLDEEPEKFGKDITIALLVKQVAVDPYSGFLTRGELIKTFIEINRTGQQLTPIDLLRGELISQMEMRNFPNSLIDEVENQFTEILQPEKSNAYYSTIATQIYNIMFKEDGFDSQLGTTQAGTQVRKSDPGYVFPNWNNLQKQDLDDLLEYIQNVWDLTKEKVAGDKTKWKWPYLAEMANYKLPFCMFVWYYYKNHYRQFLNLKRDYEEARMLEIQAKNMQITSDDLKHRIEAKEEINLDNARNEAKKELLKIIDEHTKLKELEEEYTIAQDEGNSVEISNLNTKISQIQQKQQIFPNLFDNVPDFLDGDLDTQDDSIKFYRAMVRKVLDGNIGKTEKILHQIMRGVYTTLDEISEQLNPDPAGSISGQPNENWLRAQLLSSDKSSGKPKLVFNACLLPVRGKSTLSQSKFSPLIFRNATGFYNIDHLIPDSNNNEKLRGVNELQNLVNLAPLEWENNNAALATPCTLKLSTSKIYDTMKGKHPYSKWLVEDHYKNHVNDAKVFPISGTTQTENREPESSKIHPLDSQVNLLEGHQNSIANQRISKLIEILAPIL